MGDETIQDADVHYDVFLSHAGEDAAFCDWLVRELGTAAPACGSTRRN